MSNKTRTIAIWSLTIGTCAVVGLNWGNWYVALLGIMMSIAIRDLGRGYDRRR